LLFRCALRLARILVNGILRRREHSAQHRLEKFKRRAFQRGIERGVVIDLAKARGALEMRMAAELLSHVSIQPDVLEEVVALEDAVLLDHPVIRFGYERLYDGRSDIRMVP